MNEALEHWKRKRIKRLIDDVRRKGLNIFAGAGVSVLPPSSCPTWHNFQTEILNNLITELSQKVNQNNRQINYSDIHEVMKVNLRPEAFMSALSEILGEDFVADIISVLDVKTPNENHMLVSLLAHHGILKSLITTNFETCFEFGMQRLKVKYSPIRDDNEASDWISNGRDRLPLFKPHGCLTKKSSLQFKLDDIQSLSKSKREVFSELLKGRPLLIMGYSGNDEDIFPIIKDEISSIETAFSLVHPLSSPTEPIQSLNLASLERIVWSPRDILSLILNELAEPNEAQKELTEYASNVEGSWEARLAVIIKQLNWPSISLCLGQLLSDSGNYILAIIFTNLVATIGAQSKLNNDEIYYLWLANKMQGRAKKELGNNDEAVALLEKNVQISSKMDQPDMLAMALLEKCHVHLRGHQLEAAEKDLVQVNQLFSTLGNEWLDAKPNVLQTYFWYSGILHRKNNHFEKAEEQLVKAMEMAETQNDTWHSCRVGLDLGNVYLARHAYPEAMKLLIHVRDKSERNTDWSTAAKAAKNLGGLLRLSNTPELGYPELERSIRLFELAGDPDGIDRAKRMLSCSASEMFELFFLGENCLTKFDKE